MIRDFIAATRKSWIGATRNSWDGIRFAFGSERHVREEFATLALSIPLSFLVADSGWVRISLVGVVINLLVIEFLNTSIEKLCDHVHIEHHVVIKAVKDMGSAAVLGGLALVVLVWGLALWQAICRWL